MSPLRRSPRLKEFDYLGPLAAHVTFVTRRRQALFVNVNLAAVCIKALGEAEAHFSAKVHAYCVMPDHVHALVEMPEGVSLEDFAHRFKQLSGFRLKNLTGSFAWQTSYHDHVLRTEEAIVDVAHYVWDNPVKEGLVESWLEYPSSGPRSGMLAELGES